METAKLKKFAQFARRNLIEQVSVKLTLVLAENSAAQRESAQAVKQLEEAIKTQGKEQVVERVAYIWFNRFCALRFMDVNRYTRIGVVSPAEGQFQPEILAEAKMGYIDEEMVPEKTRQQIFALLDGKAPSRDPQGEAYRLLVVAACNFWNKAMPFLFQRIDDYTELLMPDDLLSGNSILTQMREVMTGIEDQELGVRDQGLGVREQRANPLSLSPNPYSTSLEVEVIGWLYQFYISEKKDEVFAGLKKNKKITPENIPAATQLFTPHWIVRYLVENSLGRLWMLNRPNSRLVDKMEYYIQPDASGVRDQGLGVSKKTGENDGSEKLSGSYRLAEGYELGGTGLSGIQGVSQGGALRIDQPVASGSDLDSIQYSRGTRAQLDFGVQELPIDSSGFKGGSGNSNPDCSTAALPVSSAGAGNTLPAQGNFQNACGVEKEARDQRLGISEANLTPNPYSLTPDFLRIDKPEDIKICDPACGSGHMLTYAFDLLYAIYEEEGYAPAEIPGKILTHNLYGIEIDERAGELAAFALTMKARSRSRRFFRRPVVPNICVLQNVSFEEGELEEYLGARGQRLGISEKEYGDLLHDLNSFEEADNFGSLIRPVSSTVIIERALASLTNPSSLNPNPSLFESITHQKVLRALQQAEYLSPKYHVVIANPPYMGSKGMNSELAAWLKIHYADVKSDLFSAFIVRNTELALPKGQLGFMSPFVWMFISSYEKLRSFLINQKTITSLVQLEYSGFDGATVPICTFTVENANRPEYKGGYIKLSEFRGSENQGPRTLEAIKNPNCGWFHRASAADFKKIPGSPITYWVTDAFRRAFEGRKFIEKATPIQGIITGRTELFLRLWSEVSRNKIKLPMSPEKPQYWVPYAKGGGGRKWFGNNEYLINWKNEGRDLVRSRSTNAHFYFKPCLTWTLVTSADFSARYCPDGFLWDVAGSIAFPNEGEHIEYLLGFLCSSVCRLMLNSINPTLNTNIENIENLPVRDSLSVDLKTIVANLIEVAKTDWDSYETSWDFLLLPLISVARGQGLGVLVKHFQKKNTDT
jgi:hypothetical protein